MDIIPKILEHARIGGFIVWYEFLVKQFFRINKAIFSNIQKYKNYTFTHRHKYVHTQLYKYNYIYIISYNKTNSVLYILGKILLILALNFDQCFPCKICYFILI